MNFLELARKRCSVRQYGDRSVEPEKVDYVLEAARLAPSAVNKQPWRILLIESEEKRLQLQKLLRPRMVQASSPLLDCLWQSRRELETGGRWQGSCRCGRGNPDRASLLSGSRTRIRHLLGMQFQRGSLQATVQPARRPRTDCFTAPWLSS